VCAVAVAALVGCSRKPASPEGGDIVTVNDAQPNAEAVAVKGGKTVYKRN